MVNVLSYPAVRVVLAAIAPSQPVQQNQCTLELSLSATTVDEDFSMDLDFRVEF